MYVTALVCTHCGAEHTPRRAPVVRHLPRARRAGLRLRRAASHAHPRADRGRAEDALALRRPPARLLAAGRRPARRPVAARRRAAPRRGARPARAAHQDRGSQPDPLVQGPGRRRSRPPRPLELGLEALACASTGNLAGAVAAQAAALGLEAYIFIPADLEREKIISASVPGAHIFAVEGNYDDANRLCARARVRAAVGLRQLQRAAVLRTGLEDGRVRDRRAARLAPARSDDRADRLGLAVHEDRSRLPRAARGRPRRGRRRRCPTARRPRAARRSRPRSRAARIT